MNIGWDKEIKQIVQRDVEAVDFSADKEADILRCIHTLSGTLRPCPGRDTDLQIPLNSCPCGDEVELRPIRNQNLKKRRTIMKITKKKTGILIAAALIIISAVTVLGAGNIAYLLSGHSIKDEVTNIAELKTQAQNAFNETVRLPEEFSSGSAFSRGIMVDVKAQDENGNTVGSFPEMNAYYSDEINVHVSKPIDGINQNERTALASETYQGLQINGYTDNYLFLPPDVQPSEEEQKLEAEGQLMISYGSSEVERKTFTNVSWDEGELHYLISTFEDVTLEEMMAMAKEIIDCEK